MKAQERTPTRARDLLAALGLAGLALPGALAGAHGGSDPGALLLWIAFVAPAAGVLAGSLRLRAWPLAAAVPGTWMVLVALVDALEPRDLPSPVWAALAWTGLYFAGLALGRGLPKEAGFRAVSAVFLLTCLFVFAPLAGGLLAAPWPAPLTARLLDLSPATLLAECAGLDWLRHPAIYDTAATVDIDPSLRHAFRGALAGPLVFVVGCALAWIAARRARA